VTVATKSGQANLVVKVQGDDSGLKVSLASAGNKVSGFEQLVKGTGKTFANVWTAGAAGAVAITTDIFKAGVSMNALTQNANVAFETLLGGKDAAKAFTDELYKFTGKSPFPKDAMLRMSQQMLAFGIESKKVVPILGAVQDAVAAAGGSSDEMEKIISIMSDISATGKITGMDLTRMGNQGVDAAGMIGKAMGKSGQQIKEEITAGTIPAAEAIDAMAKGMEMSFKGAAEGIKQNWDGVVQSFGARKKQLGAILAEPFISASGGGMAVTWLQDINSGLTGLKPVFAAISGWIMDAFGPSFQFVGDTLKGISDSLAGLTAPDISSFVSDLSGLAPILGGLTGALAAFVGGGIMKDIPVLGNLFKGLSGPIGMVAGAIVGLIMLSPELQAMFGSALKSAMDAFAPSLPIIKDALVAIGGAFVDLLGSVAPLIPILAELAGGILSVLAPILAEIATSLLPPLAAGFTAILPSVMGLVQAFLPLLDLLPPLVSVLLPPLAELITLVFAAIGPLIPVVTQLVAAVVKLIASALTPFIPVLGQVLTAVIPILAPVLQLVGIFASLLGALMPLLNPIIKLASLLAGALASAIGTLLGSGLSAVAGVFQGIADAIAGVVGWVQDLIGWFAKLKPPAFLSGITGKGAPAPPVMLGYGVSYSAPTLSPSGPSRYAYGFQPAAQQPRQVTIYVQTPLKGDEIARNIRSELLKLDRRERGVIVANVRP
jgi:tape measure domain-containing protein